MKKEMKSFDRDIKKGDFKNIGNYLKKNIHEKGRSVSSKDIVGKINVKDYLDYLEDKFEV